jgi:toxoflavin synthase
MTTDYNPIAKQYKRAKLQPWRSSIESFTLLGLIGDLAGKSVVDVACGEGFYTRQLKLSGAKRVKGIDLSEGMVELARAQETANPLGIDYVVGDARKPQADESHDLVVAAYLLNYARDRNELAKMCRGVASYLKPGGRFVTVNGNPALDFSKAPSFRKYGFETRVAGEFREGVPIQWEFFLDDGPLSIENYHLDVALHEEALRTAGFKEVRWHRPQLALDAEAAHGAGFWSMFLDHSPIAFIECQK